MTQTFKDFEHDGWQSAVEQYDNSFGNLTRQAIPFILDVLTVKQGTRFLDVACGPGYLAAAAKQRGAPVKAVDFSAAMLAKARLANPGIDYAEGDAEDLQAFADNSFDAVGMNFGILHLGRPEAALTAMRRVLARGGRAAFTAWATEQEAVGFALVLRAIERFGNPHIPLPAAPPFFRYSEPATCMDALSRCGFVHPNAQVIPQTWELDSPDEVFEAFLHGTARTGGLLRRQTPEQLLGIREAVRASATAYVSQGKVHIPMPAVLAWAQKE
ncbi:MAG TPA: methyltransferase domain-containing protein [Gemmataceae bacterium]|nr:methyltransferase domain-containing protein [Gemmataceae bacterium]